MTHTTLHTPLYQKEEASQHVSHQTILSIKPLCANLKCRTREFCPKASFCDDCQQARLKGHFCFYCCQIYFFNYHDGDGWIQCDRCQKWIHTDCAIKNGVNLDNSPEFQYFCPPCQSKMGNKNRTPKIKKLTNHLQLPKFPVTSRVTKRVPLQEYQELASGKNQLQWCVRKEYKESLKVSLQDEQIKNDLRLLQEM